MASAGAKEATHVLREDSLAIRKLPPLRLAQGAAQTEVDWDRLDKGKFFGFGAGLFTGVTLLLYPFSVIKTRIQISNAMPPSAVASGLQSTVSGSIAGTAASTSGTVPTMYQVARSIARTEGVPGFYRGLTTVVTGMLPGRVLYMGTLEAVKKAATSSIQALGGPQALGLSDAAAAGLVSGLGGTCASLSTQAVVVPVDVISSRLMAQAADTSGLKKYKGGWDALRTILRTEGVGGLYRGFGVSVITYAPSSFTWWSTYGGTQRLFWNAYYSEGLQIPGLLGNTLTSYKEGGKRRHGFQGEGPNHSRKGFEEVAPQLPPPPWLLAAVQAVGGCLAGVSAAAVTTPLDTVKTRIQVERGTEGVPQRVNVAAVVRRLLAEGGVGAFYKGLLPRSISMALWGTAMVSTYEFLKRLCIKEE